VSQGIFISYRRDDTSGFAGRLFDRMTASFPHEQIFLDVQGIEPGANFVEVLSAQVGGCDVLLVLIGRRWLAGTTDGRMRLHDPKDFVRIEIEVALARDVRVIPLLIDGAGMPVAEDLPESIRPLVLRQALEISHQRFEADTQILIQTLRRNVAEPIPSPPGRPDATAAPLRLPDKPSIAILPFANMGGDKDQEHLADGLVEDTLTALSQVSSLFVVARNSSFAFKGKNADVRDVGRQLGVRYVMEGSVRRSGDRLRVTAQLIDAADGSHIWAERYDRRVQDLFDIQDELTKEIVTALRIQLTDGEQANILLRSTNNIEAWGYAMRGADHIWRGTAADMAQARVFLQRAVACDPAYAKARP
jgi:TolB-like protein